MLRCGVFPPLLLGLTVLHAIGRVVLSIPHAPGHALSRVINDAMSRCTDKLCTLCEPLPVQGRTAWSHQPVVACTQYKELKNLLGAGSGKAIAFPCLLRSSLVMTCNVIRCKLVTSTAVMLGLLGYLQGLKAVSGMSLRASAGRCN